MLKFDEIDYRTLEKIYNVFFIFCRKKKKQDIVALFLILQMEITSFEQFIDMDHA